MPGFKAGGPIKSCNHLIQHLKSEFDFYVITRDTDYTETVAYLSVKSNEWNDCGDGLKVYYFSKDRLNSTQMKKVVAGVDFDFAYVNGMYSFSFSILPLMIFRDAKSNVIVASRGMLGAGAINVFPLKKKVFLFIAKVLGLYKQVVFHATNEDEKLDIKQYIGKNTKVKVAPNLSDPNSITPFDVKLKEPESLKLVSVARISPEKNLKYCFEVLQGVKGDVSFDVYGPIYSKKYWSLCEKEIAKLGDNVKVTYKGVLEGSEVVATLKSYDMLFMPTLGENFGHTILESFLAGRPVLISDRTPWKNLNTESTGFDLPLSEPESFTKVLNELVEIDDSEFQNLAKSAYQKGLDYVNDKEQVEQNKQLFLKT